MSRGGGADSEVPNSSAVTFLSTMELNLELNDLHGCSLFSSFWTNQIETCQPVQSKVVRRRAPKDSPSTLLNNVHCLLLPPPPSSPGSPCGCDMYHYQVKKDFNPESSDDQSDLPMSKVTETIFFFPGLDHLAQSQLPSLMIIQITRSTLHTARLSSAPILVSQLLSFYLISHLCISSR